MSEYDLLAAWFRIADWAAYDLAKDGAEAVILMPLGRLPRTAAFIARHAFTSSNYRHRKLAASLAGWVQQPPPDLLTEFLQQEADRDQRLPIEDIRRLESQSVVEDIVFSAAFWARSENFRPSAVQLLRDVVERTLAGEYWNTSAYALTTLCHHQSPGCDELLMRFKDFSVNAKINHPSRPSLTQEKQFAQNLASKNPKTLQAIESVLERRQEAARIAVLDDTGRTAIDDYLHVAERFEAAAA